MLETISEISIAFVEGLIKSPVKKESALLPSSPLFFFSRRKGTGACKFLVCQYRKHLLFGGGANTWESERIILDSLFILMKPLTDCRFTRGRSAFATGCAHSTGTWFFRSNMKI